MNLFIQRINSIDGSLTIPLELRKQLGAEESVVLHYTTPIVTIGLQDPGEGSVKLRVDSFGRIKIPLVILEKLNWKVIGFALTMKLEGNKILLLPNEQIVQENNCVIIPRDFYYEIGFQEEGYITVIGEAILLSTTKLEKRQVIPVTKLEEDYHVCVPQTIADLINLKVGDRVYFEIYQNELIIRKL